MTLPSFNAADLVELATQYFPGHRAMITGMIPKLGDELPPVLCSCGQRFDDLPEHDRHVAELIVSAVTMELIGLAHDQQRPELSRLADDQSKPKWHVWRFPEGPSLHTADSYEEAQRWRTANDQMTFIAPSWPSEDEKS